jgi:hypothetical protein
MNHLAYIREVAVYIVNNGTHSSFTSLNLSLHFFALLNLFNRFFSTLTIPYVSFSTSFAVTEIYRACQLIFGQFNMLTFGIKTIFI